MVVFFGYMYGDEILPIYVGMKPKPWNKDPYEATRIQWKVISCFFSWLMYLCWKVFSISIWFGNFTSRWESDRGMGFQLQRWGDGFQLKSGGSTGRAWSTPPNLWNRGSPRGLAGECQGVLMVHPKHEQSFECLAYPPYLPEIVFCFGHSLWPFFCDQCQVTSNWSL